MSKKILSPRLAILFSLLIIFIIIAGLIGTRIYLEEKAEKLDKQLIEMKMAQEYSELSMLYINILSTYSMSGTYPEVSDIGELQNMSYKLNQNKTGFEIRGFGLDKISGTSDDVVKTQNF